jgi:nicotinic acid mononucleotide adenylyltransferase
LYIPLALSTGLWFNPLLIALAAGVMALAPSWAQLVNVVEDRILHRLPYVTIGRIGRFLFQLPANYLLVLAVVVAGFTAMGQRVGWMEIGRATLLITAAGQGFQYVAIRLANRGRGYKQRNVLASLGATAMLIGFIEFDSQVFSLPFLALLSAGGVLVTAELVLVLLSDLRALVYPRGGVGLFIGTFNPVHKTHIAIIKRALQERRLERVLIHATVIPKLHAQALCRGEIEIVAREAGMRVYGMTAKADSNVNYFPTGKRFFEYETRTLMITLSLADAGLDERVEVLSYCDIYAQHGFYGVIKEVKRRYPHQPLHGLHGSDAGGMWNRAIYDESGWIYPIPTARVDPLSATAIRNGVSGLMTPNAEAVVQELRKDSRGFAIGLRQFTVHDGVVRADLD